LLTSPLKLGVLRQRKIDLPTTLALEIGYCDNVFARYYDRIVFPIYSMYGEHLGFQGRAAFDWQAENKPKWWNDSFDKNRHLYGFHQNQKLILEKGYVWVVEGPLDVASLLVVGEPAVALLGAAPSIHHAFHLSQVTDQVYEWFDPDASGDRARKTLEELTKKVGIRYTEAHADDGDPNLVLTKYGRRALTRYIDDQKDPV